MNKLIALMLAFLIISSSFSYAQVYSGPFGVFSSEEEAGEVFVINVVRYEPPVVVSSVLEERNVPVYAFLRGATLGSLVAGKESPLTAPLYGIPPIKTLDIVPADAESYKYISSILPIEPRKRQFPASDGFIDLGYLIVQLRRIEKEEDIPDEIVLNMTARIRFDLEVGWGEFGAQDLILREETDKNLWREDFSRQTSFWGRRGYVRAARIDSTTVNLEVYDGWLNKIANVRLVEGDTERSMSRPLRLRGAPFIGDFFRIKLRGLFLPQNKAEVKLIREGRTEDKILFDDTRLYIGSKWKVKDIREKRILRGEEINGKQVYFDEVLLENEKDRDRIESLRVKYTLLGGGTEEVGIEIGDIVEFEIEDKKFEKRVLKINRDGEGNLISVKVENYEELIDIKDVKVLQKPTGDVCENVELLEDEDLISDFENLNSKKLYCTAIDELKRSIELYPSSDFVNQAYSYIGKSYEGLNDYKRAISAYELVKDIEKDTFYHDVYINAQSSIIELTEMLRRNIIEEEVYLEDENVYVTLRNVQTITEEDEPVAYIKVGGGTETEYREEDILPIDDAVDGEGNFINWVLDTIRSRKILIRPVDSDGKQIGGSQTVLLNKIKKLKTISDESIEIEVVEIDSKEQAFITILPGSGRAISRSNFNLHIPIEKRAIKFSPEQIDKQINATRKLIKKLDNTIAKLDNFLSGWKAVCLVTYSALSLKNLFAGANTVKSRQNVMNEGAVEDIKKEKDGKEIILDGVKGIEEKEKGWNAFCRKHSGVGAFYKNVDECIYDNKDRINDRIGGIRKGYDYADDSMEKFKKAKTEDDKINLIIEEHQDLSDYKEEVASLYKERYLSESEIHELALSKGVGEDSVEYKENVDNLISRAEAYRKADENTNERVSDLTEEEKNDLIKKLDVSSFDYVRPRIFKAEYDAAIKEASAVTEEDTEFKIVDKIERGKSGQPFLILAGVPQPVILLEEYTKDNRPVQDSYGRTVYVNFNKKEPEIGGTVRFKTEDGKEIDRKVEEINRDGKGNPISVKVENYEEVVDIKKLKILDLYVADAEINYGNERETYAQDATAEFYENQRAYCIPTKEGNYVKVLEYFADGSPKTVEEWNVGVDGKLCTSDDILVRHRSELYYQGGTGEEQKERRAKLRELENAVNRVGPCKKEGDLISDLTNRRFKCSFDRSRILNKLFTPHCTDFMSIEDCQVMFNVCDPVICPDSRFDFGGRWPLERRSVVETGIIGSLVLGMPNWAPFSKTPQIIPPVCAPGISAGLKSFRSVAQGYNECLQVSKIEGRNVGICDKIQSVYVCELLWREGVALLDVTGGLLGLEKGFGKTTDGGEYHPATFASNLQNIADSAEFFTQQYGRNSFAAYQAGTTQEVGTELCKAAIFGRGPGIGKFFDKLTAPESPPQFIAYFDEFPWTVSAGTTRESVEGGLLAGIEQQSRYQVYYHIYAGEDTDVRYSVFLTNSPYLSQIPYTSAGQIGGDIVYVTDCPNYGVIRDFLPEGEYADKTCDLIAQSGLNQICVEFNGRVECGFGKASTSFGLNYLQDLLVAGDVKQGINSTEECSSSSARLGPSLTGGAFRGQYGAAQTGIVRVCSKINPGRGTNEKDWKEVGSCGVDSQGIGQGICWLDERTIGIKDLLIRKNVTDELKLRGITLQDDLLKEQAESIKFELNELFFKEFGPQFSNLEGWKGKYPPTDVENFRGFLDDSYNKYLNEFKDDTYRYLASTAPSTEIRSESQLRIGQLYFALADWMKGYEIELGKEKEITTEFEEILINVLKEIPNVREDADEWADAIINALSENNLKQRLDYSALVLAVIEKESSFRENTPSKEGDGLGAMQVRIGTALDLAGEDGEMYTEEEMKDILINKERGIYYGVKYLKKLIEEYAPNEVSLNQDTLGSIFAGYNAGPSTVENDKVPDSTKNEYIPIALELFNKYYEELSGKTIQIVSEEEVEEESEEEVTVSTGFTCCEWAVLNPFSPYACIELPQGEQTNDDDCLGEARKAGYTVLLGATANWKEGFCFNGKNCLPKEEYDGCCQLDNFCSARKSNCERFEKEWIPGGRCEDNICKTSGELFNQDKVICEIEYDEGARYRKNVFFTYQNDEWWWKKGSTGTYKIIKVEDKEDVDDVYPDIFGQILSLKENIHEKGIEVLTQSAGRNDDELIVIDKEEKEHIYSKPITEEKVNDIKNKCEVSYEEKEEETESRLQEDFPEINLVRLQPLEFEDLILNMVITIQSSSSISSDILVLKNGQGVRCNEDQNALILEDQESEFTECFGLQQLKLKMLNYDSRGDVLTVLIDYQK